MRRKPITALASLGVLLWFAMPASATSPNGGAAFEDVPELLSGFHLLYEQKFPEARASFLGWDRQHSDDPFGHVAVAASYLFEEFYRQGVLTADFFLDDRKFLRGIQGEPDAARMAAFHSALEEARRDALARLRANGSDPEALFALTLAAGMEADALSLLEHRQFESLRQTANADAYARKLLAVRPDAADAWLALGAANYIIGSLSRPKRVVLWFGGIHGDRALGMEQLRKASTDGRYLRPFAKTLLALAARRERQNDLARELFRELTEEFPSSPLFAAEYARAIRDSIPPGLKR